MIKTDMYRLLFFLLFAGLSLTSCDDSDVELDDEPDNTEQVDKLKVIEHHFSPDYKDVYVSIKQMEDIGSYILSDSSKVKVEVSLTRPGLFGDTKSSFPRLKGITQVGSEAIDSLRLSMLVLVDLTLPQPEIDAQYNAVREIRPLFTKNLYLSFIRCDGVSESMQATDYVLEHNFIRSTGGEKRLYRSVLTKIDEMLSPDGPMAASRYHAMLVFSDGRVYNGDQPIDPDHYSIQEQLVSKASSLDQQNNVFYTSFRGQEGSESDNDVNLLKLVCKESNGFYFEAFDWSAIKHEVLHRFNIDIPDYRLTLVNPDGKLFKGNSSKLKLKFADQKCDTVFATAETPLVAGSIFDPIIVNGDSTQLVLYRGCMWVLFLLAVVYLCFQFVWPFLSYKWFCHRYVVKYTGPNMIFHDHPVGDTCYYCKGAFEEDDDIVVKCDHVMHKTCWDENGYHCPEHGRHCHNGSHYYNSARLTDPQNASFYLKWTVLSVLAGTMAWIVFTSIGHSLSVSLMEALAQYVYAQEPGTQNMQDMIGAFGDNFNQLPSFGLWISFFTTFFLCLLSVFHHRRLYFYGECLLRAFVAGVGGYVSFGLAAFLSVLFNLYNHSFLLAWIPWPLAGSIITFCVTWRTRIDFHRRWVVISFLLGIVSMLLWGVLFTDSVMDFRGVLLISHLVFSVGIGLCIAEKVPRPERYFLRVEGTTKPIDVAIYKWFRDNADAVVTIGKSVDCHLQMTWDVGSTIAPVQAQVRRVRGQLTLVALEDGVMVDGQPLQPDVSLPLYHGTCFTIGHTKFTYLEKDI